jgi:hypothetical protein
MTKESMTPRERVLSTVKGQSVDRVPVFYWLNPHAACQMMSTNWPAKSKINNFLGKFFWKQFLKEKSWMSRDNRNFLPLVMHMYANRQYVMELGADMANMNYGSKDYWLKESYKENGKKRIRDGFGSLRGMGGIYLEVIEPSIKDINDIINFNFPDATDDKHYTAIRKFRAKYPDACIYTDNFGVQDLPATNIWEMSQFLLAMVDYPDEIKTFQKRFADYMIDIALRSIEAGSDVIIIYDDYGYTDRTLISMEMWKEFTYPHLKRQVEAIHEAGGIAMLHSCGYQMPFLPHYVEIGVDMLQSMQPKAGNDFAEAYREFGDKLTFVTGIDIQQGEMMTPHELREDILKAYRTGGRNGRHILGMTHMLQYTMPQENMQTIFQTVSEIQAGMHD